MSSQIRVRYAPSPTGHLHIGNARTALFNYLFARKYDGKFIIRIEDTDTERNIAGGEQSQLTYLKWLGIEWDESIDIGGDYGPYRQTERLDMYQKYADQLMAQGLAYKCYCTKEELTQEQELQRASGDMRGYSGKCRHLTSEQRAQLDAQADTVSRIRFVVPQDRTYTWTDLVKGPISVESQGTGDFVIIKQDGIPTYNFAVVVDDYLMKISHVLRGEDHISNTPRQLMIYEALGFEAPTFAHMTLIVNESRKKLSKRDESIIQFIEQYDHLGYLPQTMFNFIALLGWSPEGEQELFTKEQLIERFDPNRLLKSPALFDPQKLAWMNGEYLRALDVDTLTAMCTPFLQQAHKLPEPLSEQQAQWVKQLVALFQEKLKAASDIVALTQLFFQQEVVDEVEASELLAQPEVTPVLTELLAQLEQVEQLDADIVKKLIKQVQVATGCKGKQLFMPIRAAVTGQMHGSDLNQTLVLLGKQTLMERLSKRLQQTK